MVFTKKWKKKDNREEIVFDNYALLYINKYDVFSSKNVEETTIIVQTENDICFYILNGDWRKEYQEMVDKSAGLMDFLEFFKNHSEHKSEWSD